MDKRISRQYFNNLAGTWDDTARNNDPVKLRALAKCLDLPSDGWILDVGTGTGVFLPYLKELVNGKSQILSMDFAVNMVALAKSKQAGNGIQFICAEIETLRFGSELFDSVICYSTFPHFHNKPLALKNIYTNLKPGGRLFICHTASREFINQTHSKIPDLKDHLIPDNDEMKDLLISSGFFEHEIASKEDYYLVTAKK
ncbi:MAG: class I SAM-dependent methyltransferase [Pelolinea sp.]|nr:class I SAM-dependent methyltransferase [Pelolinea sp.]